MRILGLTVGLAALALGASIAAAQQRTPPQRPDRQPGAMMGPEGMAAPMQMMDSLNARLDTLVSRMNRATGDRKVTAMADVINQLVAQRKVTHAHMREMMNARKGMMDMKGMMDKMGDSTPGARPAPPPGTDSMSADTAGHAEHHPPK